VVHIIRSGGGFSHGVIGGLRVGASVVFILTGIAFSPALSGPAGA
jgi:hypothetical protein